MLATDAPFSSLSSAIQGLSPVAERKLFMEEHLLVCHHSAPALSDTRQLPALQADVFTCIAQYYAI